MLHRYSLFLRGVISLAFVSYYINYFAYLSVGRFNYAFNMMVNVATGVIAAVGWFVWCHFVRTRRPYFRRVLRFYVLMALAMSLELLDFPPILWILDAHALWHLATVPLAALYYEWVFLDVRFPNTFMIVFPFQLHDRGLSNPAKGEGCGGRLCILQLVLFRILRARHSSLSLELLLMNGLPLVTKRNCHYKYF